MPPSSNPLLLLIIPHHSTIAFFVTFSSQGNVLHKEINFLQIISRPQIMLAYKKIEVTTTSALLNKTPRPFKDIKYDTEKFPKSIKKVPPIKCPQKARCSNCDTSEVQCHLNSDMGDLCQENGE